MYNWIGVSSVLTLFLLCLGLTAALTPLVMKFARRIGAVDTGGYRKIYEGAMPLLGGLAIAIPIVLLCLATALAGTLVIFFWKWIWSTSSEWLNPLMSLRPMRRELFLIALGGIAVVALGIYDDKYGMRARYKLAGQLLIGLVVCAAGVTLREVEIPGFGRIMLHPVLGIAFTVLWIAGLINAFNLIDGMDGLASGVAFIIAGGLVVLGILGDSPLVVLICTALAGSTLAFLAYNFNPARIFLGDTGSMFLGYVLGTVTLLGSAKTQTATAVIAPILALGFPIYETLVSMARRFIRGKPIFAGDQYHTHHRLLRKGYTQRQTVLLLYAVTFLCMAAAVLSRITTNPWLPIGLYAATIAGIMWLAGYLRPVSLRTLSLRRQRNMVLGAFARYAATTLNSSMGRTTASEILNLGREELGLRFLEAWLEDGPSQLVSSGSADKDAGKGNPLLVIDKMTVTSADGQRVIILYQFDHQPDAQERQDVVACLAQIIEQLRIANLSIPEVQPAKSEFKVFVIGR